jgi:hypothetical protein
MTTEEKKLFQPAKAKFALGEVVMTRSVADKVRLSDVLTALHRHRHGDWGDVCPDDSKKNDESVEAGWRILSSYKNNEGVTFWVFTEADRSTTTLLLPDEY